MSSRTIEKEQRRQERLERERQLAVQQRRSRLRRRGLAALGAAGTVALVVALAALGGGGGGSSAEASGPLGTHYAGLSSRRTAAGVPTMMQTMSSSVHFHPRLRVVVDGRPIAIPAGIGIDPSQDPMQMAGIHTHDSSGTIHVEGMPDATLRQFFAVWGVPFSASRFGQYEGAHVRVLVNGKPSGSYGSLRLADGQQIEIVVTGRRKPG